jgi:phage-related protein
MDFVLVFQNANNVTGVKIENLENNEAIEILQTISAGDVIRIDGTTKKVYIGPNSVGYDGRHIFSETGANQIQITVTSTSHQYSVTMSSNYILL